ncbi:MAG: permease [Sphingobacteriia bacterium]|nr:permease [Sphingobacteriia bacterium]
MNKSISINRKTILPILLLPVWYLLYHNLQFLTDLLFYDLLEMNRESHLTESLHFFVFEVPKVLLLLVLIIFFVGIIRSFFTTERTRKALEGKNTFTGNVMASLLGIVTPFCSCSAIPLFLGFIESGVPLGITFSFLIAAPMINEVAVILLYGMFGWQTALIYVLMGLAIAISAGWIIGKLKLEKWVEDWVYTIKTEKSNLEEEKPTWENRIEAGYSSVKEIIKKVWIYIIAGIAIGAAAHGYVPTDFMASLMGKDQWYAVPLSTLIGIPLYSNAAGIVPIVSVLLEKGASLGTSLSFMMSVIALSLPEIIILRKVLKLPLIFTFIAIVGSGIMLVGFLFNIIF